MQKIIFLSAVFAISFVNVMSVGMGDKWLRLKCHRFVPWRFSVCKRRCPQLFPNGHCNHEMGKWHCICKGTGSDKKVYSLEEANCIQQVSSGEKNPVCVSELCPYGFQNGGHIVQENGEWQWYCSAKEFGNHRQSTYSLDEAREVYASCNSASSDKLKDCRQLCPENYKTGECFMDRDPLVLRCGCTQGYKLSDWYGVQEAYEIVNVCSRTVQDHKGCSELCPAGFKYARCFSVGKLRFCGCKQGTRGNGWYTIAKVRDMVKICNSEIQDHKACKGLCPEGYRKDGRCSNESGYLECLCFKEGRSTKWITLREAIYNFDKKVEKQIRKRRPY